jgi:hypothetical protein
MIVASSPQKRFQENRKSDNEEPENTNKIKNDVPLNINSSSIPQFFFPKGNPISDDQIRNEIGIIKDHFLLGRRDLKAKELRPLCTKLLKIPIYFAELLVAKIGKDTFID